MIALSDVNKITGANIKNRRDALNLSQAALAEMVGRSRPSIANIERGTQGLSIPMLYLFAEELNTTPLELLPNTEGGEG